jgi:hypothetical protein
MLEMHFLILPCAKISVSGARCARRFGLFCAFVLHCSGYSVGLIGMPVARDWTGGKSLMNRMREWMILVFMMGCTHSIQMGDTDRVGETGAADTGSFTDTSETNEETETDTEETDLPEDPCEGLLVCDDFESGESGKPPDAARWMIVAPDCQGDGVLEIDDSVSHSGSHSVKVTSSGGYCNHIFMTPVADVSGLGPKVYGRFWMRFNQSLDWSHITFLAMEDEREGKDLRMGGQSQVIMWNRESDDATLPELSPTGISMSWAPQVDQWSCIQFYVDEEQGYMETWVDEKRIEGLVLDDEPTPDVDAQWLRKPDWSPHLIDAKFGWEGYGGGFSQVWFDDVALGSVPIGCAIESDG